MPSGLCSKRSSCPGFAEASLGSLVPLVGGLTFWWPFFRRFEYASLFGLYENPARAMWSAYAPTMALLIACILALMAFRRRLEPALRTHPIAASLLGAVGSLGYLLTFCSPALGLWGVAASWAGSVCTALGYAILTACWGLALSDASPKTAAGSVVLAFAMSSLLQLTAFLPGTVTVAIAIAAPGISAACWALCPHNAQRDVDYGLQSLRRLPLSVIGVLGAFLVAGRIAVGLLAWSSDSIPSQERLLSIACSIALATALFAAARGTANWARTFQIAWSALAVVFMGGMFMLLIGNDAASHVATGLLQAVLGCFEMALFAILALAVRGARASGVLVFGLATVLFRIVPNFAGKNLTPMLLGADSAWAQQVVGFVVPAMTFLLVVATIVFMNARIMGKARWFGEEGEPSFGMASEGIRESTGTAGNRAVEPTGQVSDAITLECGCHALSEQAGLTPRETDVLMLVGEGRSYQKIADSLGISLGTVQGHVKSVYRKLGVHTRQEVIDLLHRG